jgi:hypothetical protein
MKGASLHTSRVLTLSYASIYSNSPFENHSLVVTNGLEEIPKR